LIVLRHGATKQNSPAPSFVNGLVTAIVAEHPPAHVHPDTGGAVGGSVGPEVGGGGVEVPPMGVGTSVGADVGGFVGTLVGVAAGVDVGAGVCVVRGVAVDAAVGPRVGATVGAEVGATVGGVVGSAVGAFVGPAVGETVTGPICTSKVAPVALGVPIVLPDVSIRVSTESPIVPVPAAWGWNITLKRLISVLPVMPVALKPAILISPETFGLIVRFKPVVISVASE
jgi:hypothetical protein